MRRVPDDFVGVAVLYSPETDILGLRASLDVRLKVCKLVEWSARHPVPKVRLSFAANAGEQRFGVALVQRLEDDVLSDDTFIAISRP